MYLKMKDLIEQTGESKSTILYYIKEGLLPEPKKPKPNVHLYDKSCVNIIKFIKYLQKSFSYSISQIKTILDNNQFSFDGSFESILKAIEALQGGEIELYSKDDIANRLNIDTTLIDKFISKGYILNKDRFNKKDIEAIEILVSAKEMNLDFKLFDLYVNSAKELSKDEHKIGYKFLEDNSKEHNKRYELLFEVILNYKPYIFNSYTISEHKGGLK